MKSFLSKVYVRFLRKAPLELREAIVDQLERCIAAEASGLRSEASGGFDKPAASLRRSWYRDRADPLLYLVEIEGPHDTEDIDRVLEAVKAEARAARRPVTFKRRPAGVPRRGQA